MSRPVALLALFFVTLGWSAALAAAPRSLAPRLSAVTYAAGSLVCHQRPERSFHQDGAQYPICARCAGLYGGAVIGVLAWMAVSGVGRVPRAWSARLTRPALVRWVLIVAAIPTLATAITSWLGWWDAGNVLRAALAVPLGATIASVIAAVAAGDLR